MFDLLVVDGLCTADCSAGTSPPCWSSCQRRDCCGCSFQRVVAALLAYIWSLKAMLPDDIALRSVLLGPVLHT